VEPSTGEVTVTPTGTSKLMWLMSWTQLLVMRQVSVVRLVPLS